MIAHNPLHGSGQAALPHPALALGDDARFPRDVSPYVGPSASPYSVGVPEEGSYAAEYPAHTFPCQRFDVTLASDSA